jgi:diguanylate cyclase (GGDEF)-like protein
MNHLAHHYDAWVVAASIVNAVLAAYVALDLVQRIRAHKAGAARVWWIGGSLAMGTGIWSMHFIGMLAFTLPISLGYTGAMTLLSWVAAVAVSAIGLHVATCGEQSNRRLTAAALAMGLGICAMHYIGMAAIDIAPGIEWNMALVAASALIAVVASGAALLIFRRLRSEAARRLAAYKLAAAVVMGLAITGMHYTGMAAASFAVGAVCFSADQLGGGQLGPMVMFASGFLLLMTLLTSTLDARMQERTAALANSLKSANLQLQSANDELQRRAFMDPLTGLSNRLLFDDRLAHAASRRDGRNMRRLAVLFVDLDGFKPVNDSLGHAAGDRVLKDVASRLKHVAREGDTVARIGGDEFVLLMEDVADAADALSLASRLVASLAQPFMQDGRSLHVSASVGIAVYPDQGQAAQLMVMADAAMYAAKRTGGNTFALFESHMNAGASQQLELQLNLRQALANGQLSLHYQPKFNGLRAEMCGVEALMRWTHPQHGPIAPNVFIPIAERFGLINEMGNWAIGEVCRQMQAWDDQGLATCVAVNLSVHQLRQEDLAERIGNALEWHGIAAERLLCEITESVAMEDIEATQHTFDALRKIGVFLSIDDFGTGYSSLSYLRTLPATQLKIDRSFIQDLEGSNDARAVVDAVIKLAHALELSVVAEGVETEGQRDILLDLHCDELQGYLFARPMPAQALFDWVARMPARNMVVAGKPTIAGGAVVTAPQVVSVPTEA